MFISVPLTSIVLWLPIIGAIAVALLPGPALARPIALLSNAASLLGVLALIGAFDVSLATAQLTEHAGADSIYRLGVDGISLPLLALCALLCLAATIGTAPGVERPQSFYAWLLVLQGAVNGVFLAQDWALFYIFWELTLIPLFFLIGLWGGPQRSAASLTFLLYTMGGSTFTLLAMLTMKLLLGLHDYSMDAFLEATRQAAPDRQMIFFLIFSLGFAVKIPLLPLHGWLPLTYVEAPATVTLLLAGILSKMGVYGLLRALQMFPGAAPRLGLPLLLLGGGAVIYGGLLTWRKVEIKRMIAWSSISHMGTVLIGISAALPALPGASVLGGALPIDPRAPGLQGAMLQLLCHGLSIAALLLCAGWIAERFGTLQMEGLSGALRRCPRAAGALVLSLGASIALPGSGGFVAEFQVFSAALARWGWPVALLSLGALTWAATCARTVDHLIAAPEGGLSAGRIAGMGDMGARHLIAVAGLLLALLALGLFPDAALRPSQATLRALAGEAR